MKFGQDQMIRHNSRRALSVINHNLAEAKPYPCLVNKKKLKPSVPNSNDEFGDCIFTDVEQNKASSITIVDHPVPMFLEEPAETWHSAAEEMEEVEMEDIVEEEPIIVDIDGCDAKNPLEAVEYVQDLHAHYRKMEVYIYIYIFFQIYKSKLTSQGL